MQFFKRTWIRATALAIALLTFAVIIALSIWTWQLNGRIEVGLKEKKFLPPTQYFSSPEWIFAGQKLTAGQLAKELLHRRYQERTWNDKLRPGEFVTGTNAECAQSLPTPWPETSQTCVLLKTPATLDPEIKDFDLQMVTFNAEGWPDQFYRGNPLISADAVALEPTLVAQYLDKEPIQQTYTPLGEMPVACLNGVLAIEDPKFLDHSGVSLTAIARAAFRNLTGSRFAQGGSTITQQMVKNYFLTSERTLKRKITEFLMSLLLELHASKDEIFETYLNIIYLGQSGVFQIRGFPAASEYYFQKKIAELNTGECALLAAVLNSPGRYNPFRNPEPARKRRDLVLDKMVEHHLIGDLENQEARRQPMPSRAEYDVAETAPYYIDAVRREMGELSLPIEGQKIFTGLSLVSQNEAQHAVQEQLSHLEKENKNIIKIHATGKTLEAVLLSAQNKTGLIQALVGGRNFRLSQFNRAVDGHRQVGSIMKPFVYLAALENSTSAKPYTAMTLIPDQKFTYKYGRQSWSPENYEKEFMGDVPMYVALKSSLNSATAALGLSVGLDKVMSTAQAAGVSSRLEELPSLTLGAFELYPREVLQSYNTLANFGEKRRLRTLRAVLSETDQLVYRSEDVREQALAPGPTAVLVGMMKQTLLSGTARAAAALGFQAPAAGKTGTTSDTKDSWFGGFTPQVTTVVWVGYDENTPHYLTGAAGALPIWVHFMRDQQTRYQPLDFVWPSETVRKTVDNVELTYISGTEN